MHHCGIIAERNSWMFREQTVDDIGIDAHMEFVEPSGKSKQLLALQIKSGASWFKREMIRGTLCLLSVFAGTVQGGWNFRTKRFCI